MVQASKFSVSELPCTKRVLKVTESVWIFIVGNHRVVGGAKSESLK